MKVYVVRLNPDTRDCVPYSKYPTVDEYRRIHKDSPMEGFHEAVNFLPEAGGIKGYLPPRHLKSMRGSDNFILLTVTAKTAKNSGDQIIGIQAGCKYLGETLRRGSKRNIKELELTYHYSCPESLSLIFDNPLSEARLYLMENGRYWGQGPTYEIKKLSTIKNLIKVAINKKCIHKDSSKLVNISKLIEGKTTNIDVEISGESTFDDEVNEIIKKGKLPKAKGNKQPSQKEVTTYQYERDPEVAAYALLKSNGICADCNKNGPFISKRTKKPFLEVHHIDNLKDGGEDTIDNVIALCPNCHRKRHYG